MTCVGSYIRREGKVMRLIRRMGYKPIVAAVLLVLVAAQFVYLLIAGLPKPSRERESREAPPLSEVAARDVGSAGVAAGESAAVSAAGEQVHMRQIANEGNLDESLKNARGGLVQLVYESGDLAGSGAVVSRSEEGFDFLTAAHILKDPSELQVVYFRQRGETLSELTCLELEVVKSDSRSDLALCRVSSAIAPARDFEIDSDLSVAPERAWRVRYDVSERPEIIDATVLTHTKAAREQGAEPTSYWVLETKTEPGVSGSPLLDSEGSMIGIASGNAEGQAYYIDASEISDFLTGQARANPVSVLRN